MRKSRIFERMYGSRFDLIVVGLSEILDGLVLLFTLGRYGSSFSMRAVFWKAMREFKAQRRKK